MTGTYVALLRGTYVGGQNNLPMPIFDSKLGTTSTARNWKTVLKPHELVRSLHA